LGRPFVRPMSASLDDHSTGFPRDPHVSRGVKLGSIPRAEAVGRLAVAALTGIGLLATGCSTPGPSATPSATPTATAHPIAGNPCNSVHTTTPIADVPPACAAMWTPYQVTKVPPIDILQQEHVPAAPTVHNMTNGAVSDAMAQHWADASNWDNGWFKWAEAQSQESFLVHIQGPDLLSAPERTALDQGAAIAQPDCDLYPEVFALFKIGPDGNAYFARKGLPNDDVYVLVALVHGPCTATATYPDGHTSAIPELQQTSTVFAPGTLRSDPVLGDIWYSDAGGGCQDPAGPPASWCNR
jgi:hypothetical protein